jgi:putative ABC transport system substrate-binding protein
MKRREFVILLGAGAAWPFAAHGQTNSRRPLLVWFGSAIRANAGPFVGSFRQGLESLGYVEGRDYDFSDRFAENQIDRFPALTEEVVALKPSVIIASSSDVALAVRKVTTTIPIVSGTLADPERLGLVASYSRPGGNVTGIMPYIDGLPSKQIELARELVPSATKIGLIGNVSDPKVVPQLTEMKSAAHALAATVVAPTVESSDDIGRAIRSLASERIDVVVVLESGMLLSQRRQIAQHMAESRLPAIYGYRLHVEEGGLISYGIDSRWCWRRAATFVYKILNGASPADLPVEFPTQIQLVVNLKAAKGIGLVVPPTLLVRADELIE